MNNLLLFFFICIPVRILMAYYNSYLPLSVTAFISIGFMSIYLFDLRKTAAETFGGVMWWNNLRPVHSILYGAFTVFSYYQYDKAWMFLGLDVSIGLVAQLIKLINYN